MSPRHDELKSLAQLRQHALAVDPDRGECVQAGLIRELDDDVAVHQLLQLLDPRDVFVGVPDPQATLDEIEGAGGKTVVPVTEMEMVTFAMFTDPEGHLVGLYKAEQ